MSLQALRTMTLLTVVRAAHRHAVEPSGFLNAEIGSIYRGVNLLSSPGLALPQGVIPLSALPR
jgi:hypothetical protein